jgi:phosphatidylserine/phosphatidylglycerophosphate/cardiolipin synthase-like enzyme
VWGFFILVLGIASLFHSWSLQLTLSPLPKADGAISFYSKELGDDLALLYDSAIRRAQRTITLSIYSLSDARILRALNARAQSGVHVVLLIESSHYPEVRARLNDKVIVHAHPSQGLMHQKLLVIDSEEAWIGSANMTRASLNRYANLCMALRSREVARLLEERISAMQQEWKLEQTGGQILDELGIWFLPDPKQVERIVARLDAAQKSIRVAMFTWTHPKLVNACVRAQKRGVDVRCVLDRESSLGASSSVKDALLAANIPLRVNRGKELTHHKFALIDNTVLIHGSANWTRAAFKRNDEILCVLPALTEEQSQALRTTWERSWKAGQAPIRR